MKRSITSSSAVATLEEEAGVYAITPCDTSPKCNICLCEWEELSLSPTQMKWSATDFCNHFLCTTCFYKLTHNEINGEINQRDFPPENDSYATMHKFTLLRALNESEDVRKKARSEIMEKKIIQDKDAEINSLKMENVKLISRILNMKKLNTNLTSLESQAKDIEQLMEAKDSAMKMLDKNKKLLTTRHQRLCFALDTMIDMKVLDKNKKLLTTTHQHYASLLVQ
eukprot:Seg2618.2 transcript_id=Seg2618.2/GoldUCD/mRNA.D3Y31 product="hypothetical protein" protein_id=Seg2618.2/GoldUCD/D3Y31